MWLDLQPVDIKSRWRHNWKSAQVVNSHLVCDPTIRQPGFDLPRQQWSLLNRFRTKQGHCGVCRRKWRLTDTDLCPCGETQTMSHIVESCPLTKLNGGLSRLHSADEDTVSWLTNYGSRHAYEKIKFYMVSQKKMDPLKVNCTATATVLNIEKTSLLHHGLSYLNGIWYFDASLETGSRRDHGCSSHSAS